MSVKIAGPAGEGVLSAGHVFAKCCSRGGLCVVTENERPSLIRGGHNQFMIRAEDSPIESHIDLTNVLIALDKHSAQLHGPELAGGGAIIYDGEDFELSREELGREDIVLLPTPMRSIIKEIGAGKIVENAIALGAATALLDYDLKILEKILKEEYASHPDALKADLKAAKKGYDHIKEQNITFTNSLKPIKDAPKRMLINGLQALNLGAIRAGVSFLSQYPMTPSTGVIQGLAPHAQEQRIVIVQTEDEIASLNMALGASFAGVRAMTSSSGGGYALMNEGLSLAGVTETGIVVVEVQRGGPGTGLPTRTEQSDLLFVLHSGHGEFPHVVIAPSDPPSCYVEIQRAFNIADKYQLPVTVLLDRHNGETYRTFESFPKDLPIDRGSRWTQAEIDGAENPQRFAWNDETGVSKRYDPGTKNARFVITGNEHDTSGLINDERATRSRMMEKRLRKLEAVRSEFEAPVLDGAADAMVTFVSWGSTKPIISEARRFLERDGISSNHLHLTYINPFHEEEVTKLLESVKNPVVVENNATAQLSQLIRMRTGFKIEKAILQYDGWPFSPEDIARRVCEEVLS